MGFFSWKTVDTKRSIPNMYSSRKTFPVVLLIPKEFGGGIIEEICYEGYGDFGGRDAYALLAKWNGPENCTGVDEVDRHFGIFIACGDDKMAKLKYPLKLVSKDYYLKTNCTYESVKGFSKDCPKQGYFY